MNIYLLLGGPSIVGEERYRSDVLENEHIPRLDNCLPDFYSLYAKRLFDGDKFYSLGFYNISEHSRVISTVCSHYGLSARGLRGEGKSANLVHARHLAMYLLRIEGHTLSEIGRQLGGRNHTTVMHAIRKIKALLSGDNGISKEIKELEEKLSANE